MLSLLAAVVFAQSVSLQIGPEKQDSAARSRSDSIAVRREQVRDSMRAHRGARDSARKAFRLAHRPAVTPAVLASAFRDAGARDLLARARAARLGQDSTLNGYDANTYERLSVGMGFKRIGRDRLLMRTERATHVRWQRNKGAVIEVKGARSVFPMIEGMGKGDADIEDVSDLPYFPGQETLWVGSGLAKADVSEDEMIHPLASGAFARASRNGMLPWAPSGSMRRTVISCAPSTGWPSRWTS
jgi:hypothetical protein